jgi:predicted DNA binding CopG/RHH family protein
MTEDTVNVRVRRRTWQKVKIQAAKLGVPAMDAFDLFVNKK